MKSDRTTTVRTFVAKGWTAALLATALLAFAVVSSTVQAGRNLNPGVFPINSNPYGKSYGEWHAAWWQWAFSLPVDQNPFFDETGCANGANGQSGPVWFLTGVINVSGTAERECTMPAGKALAFPILNVECATLEGNGETEAELRACTDGWMPFMTQVFCEIDGVPVQNVMSYRAPSPLYVYGPLPENNVLQLFGFDAPAGATSLSVADGIFMLLAPLPKGQHTLHYGGTFADPINFSLDITYHLTVE